MNHHHTGFADNLEMKNPVNYSTKQFPAFSIRPDFVGRSISELTPSNSHRNNCCSCGLYTFCTHFHDIFVTDMAPSTLAKTTYRIF